MSGHLDRARAAVAEALDVIGTELAALQAHAVVLRGALDLFDSVPPAAPVKLVDDEPQHDDLLTAIGKASNLPVDRDWTLIGDVIATATAAGRPLTRALSDALNVPKSTAGGVLREWRRRTSTPAAPAAAPQRPGRVSLEEVSRVAADAIAAGVPARRAVAERFDITVGAADQRIMAARKAGHDLPQQPGGRRLVSPTRGDLARRGPLVDPVTPAEAAELIREVQSS